MMYHEISKFPKARARSFVDEKTYRHLVSKLSRKFNWTNSSFDEITYYGEYTFERMCIEGEMFHLNDFEKCVLICGFGIKPHMLTDDGRIFSYSDHYDEMVSFCRNSKDRITVSIVNEMKKQQEWNYKNKTSYKKHIRALAANKVSNRNSCIREIASLGILI